MSLLSVFNTAISALSANKGRTVLTSLGITIGIAAVIAMVAAGHGAKSTIDGIFGSIGPNLVVGFTGTKSTSGLTLGSAEAAYTRDDAEAIRKQLRHLITGCSEVTQYPTTASSTTTSHKTVFAGGVKDVFRIRRWKLQAGRFYTDRDVKRQGNVVVLGATAAEELFPNVHPDRIIGKRIRAANTQFNVIGVLAAKGATPAGDQDDILMVPITTLLRKVMGKTKCSLIIAEARSTSLVPQVKETMERILLARHKIGKNDEPDFRIQAMREYASMATDFANILSFLIYAIASVSLIVGGVGVMNIMLVSVTERTREIGIRMAVGARTKDVLRQFLTEAVILALIGGGVGIALGAGAAWAIAYFAPWDAVISPTSVIVAVITSAAVGIFFGYYPARKASLLDPIDALRYE